MSSTTPAVRLSRADRAGIRNAVETACGDVGAVWRSIVLFGSRVDPQRHGGDIDLLISLNPSDSVDAYRFTQRLRLALEDQLGEQRIDLVIDDGHNSSPFIELAKKKGVELWSKQ